MTTTVGRRATEGVATRLADALRPFVRGELPVRLRAWDGSEAGPVDAPVVLLNSPDAVRRLLWHPGELGAAQAYVTGELDVEGDLGETLSHAFAVATERGLGGRPSPSAIATARSRVRLVTMISETPARRRWRAALSAILPAPITRIFLPCSLPKISRASSTAA